MIAASLRGIGFTVFEEVHGLANNGSSRRIDIIAFKPSTGIGMIVDPSVRFESHSGQPKEVDEEKKAIYEPTIEYYKQKYGLTAISVIGLMIGARGTIPKFLHKFYVDLGLDPKLLYLIAISALRGSIYISRNHLFGI